MGDLLSSPIRCDNQFQISERVQEPLITLRRLRDYDIGPLLRALSHEGGELGPVFSAGADSGAGDELARAVDRDCPAPVAEEALAGLMLIATTGATGLDGAEVGSQGGRGYAEAELCTAVDAANLDQLPAGESVHFPQPKH
jgi:hypothetical protein